MNEDLKQEVLDVRKVIEKSTSKVSLRDLEKKGFRQVKVLRAGDINQLIMKAVQNVLAKAPRGAGMSDEEIQRVQREAKAEVDRQLAEKRQIQQAHVNLQNKLSEVNQQLATEKQQLEAQKAAFERDRQSLMERSLEGQKVASANYESQISDLRQRLAAAEANSGVSKDEYDAVRKRYATQLEDMENDVERYRGKIRQLEEDNAALARVKGQARGLEEDNQQLRAEVSRLKAELAEAASQSGTGRVDAASQAEMQRMRMEFEQNQSRMQEMLAGIATSLVEARKAQPAAAEAPDMTKQFAKLQQNISDAVRKAAGGAKGGAGDLDLTAEQAAALFANMDDVKLDTNITDVQVEERKAAGVSDKLAKLRNMRRK
jgi:chromosome segregation ATPase